MSRLRPCLFLLAALVLSASPAHAWTYGDTLTTILKPLPNLPSIVQPGSELAVWANASSSATGWSATLEIGSVSTPLTLASATWQPTLLRWDLRFQLPPGMIEELYDLTLACDVCDLDRSRHAVKVVPAYKTDFYFAQISDTHMPSHTFSSDAGFSVSDTTGMADFDAVIDDLNLIHPEFILHTGDLVNEGELEEYLGMYEMDRAQDMLNRLRDPVFVSTGNHDIGGWDPTPPPPGTSRKAWWRTFGWKWLENPPPGDPHHSQDYSFDYGALHVIGLEAYQNNFSYDDYRPDLWGPESFTAEQLSWLQNNIATAPPGSTKLAFYHYDFGGAGAAFSQINPAALGLNGVIWGHNHTVAEGNRTAVPFNLGLRSVIDYRKFRIFRVSNGVITPGWMHASGFGVDSLTTVWSGPNDGTRTALTATINNRFTEAWDHARLVFYLADQDSAVTAIGGTIAQAIRQGTTLVVYVDVSIPAQGGAVVSVFPSGPAGVIDAAQALRLEAPSPNPFVLERGSMALRFTIARGGPVRLAVLDLAGRRVANLVDESLAAGAHSASWDGRDASGARVGAGIYLVRIVTAEGSEQRRISVVR